MKILLTMLLLNFTAFAQENALEMMGIKVIRGVPGNRVFQFRDEGKITLSNKVFSNLEDATNHCKKLNLQLAAPDIQLLLLISTQGDPSLTKSMQSKFISPSRGTPASGLLGWNSEPFTKDGKLMDMYVMVDGEGSSMKTLNFKIFSADNNKIKGLPVVCSDIAENENKKDQTIDATDRTIVPEKESSTPTSSKKNKTGSEQ